MSRVTLALDGSRSKAILTRPNSIANIAALTSPSRVIRRAVAMWKASEYDDSQLLRDLTGNGLSAQLGSTAGVDANDPKFLPYKPWGVNPDGSLNFNGVMGVGVLAGASSLANITGDLDVEAKIQPTVWIGGATNTTIAGAYTGTAATTTFLFQKSNGGNLLCYFSIGGAITSRSSSVVVPAGTKWVRVTRSATTGDTKFYTSALDTRPTSGDWVQLGTTFAGTAGALSTSSIPLKIGSWGGGGSDPFIGTISRVIVKGVINGAALYDFDVSKLKTGPFYNDGLGNNWYGLGSAAWGDHLNLPNVAGNTASAPNVAGLQVTADLDLRALVAPSVWTGSVQKVFDKLNTGDQGYDLWINSSGALSFRWRTNAGLPAPINSTAAVPFAAGAPGWIRATLDVDNGAGGYTVQFFTSLDGVVWAQLGATITNAGVTQIVPGTASLFLGADLNGANRLTGRVYRAQVFASIDGTDKRADVRFDKPLKWTEPAFADDFSEPNGTNISGKSTDTGGKVWITDGAPWTVESGRMKPGALASLGSALIDAGSSTHAVEVDMVLQTGKGNYLVVRGIDTQNNYFFYSANSGSYNIYKRVAGAAISLVSGAGPTYATGNVKRWRFEADGPLLRAYVDGALVLSVVDTTWTTQTRVGVLVEGGAQTQAYDNVSIWSGLANHTDPQGNIWTINRSALQSRLKVVANSHVEMPGILNQVERISTADANELDVTGDIDARVKIAMNDWTPALATTVLRKGDGSAGNRSYMLRVNTTGTLALILSPDGTAETVATSSVATGLADLAVKWVRATWRQSDGRVQFFLSDDGVVWTQLGSDQTLAIAAIYAGLASLHLGSPDGSSQMAGKWYEGQLWKGIPGVSASARLVANPKFTALTTYAPYKEPSYVAIPSLPTVAPFSTPHNAAFNPTTGIFDVRVRIALDSVASGSNQALAAKYTSASGGGWAFRVSSTGVPYLTLADGVSAINVLTTASIPASLQGVLAWYRFTYDTATRELLFYYSLDGLAWTPIGTPVTHTAVPAVYSSTVITTVGTRNSTSDPAAGRAAELVIISNGVTVVSMSATNLLDGQAAFVDGSGFTWTVDGGARIERRTWSFTRAALSPRAELRTGRYAYLPGVLNNFVIMNNNPETIIPGDVDGRVCVAMNDYTPALNESLIYHSGDTWNFYVTTGGVLTLWWYDSGLTLRTMSCTASLTTVVSDGQKVWLRFALDVDNGTGGSTCTFYYSLDGVTWTQLGSVVTVATTSQSIRQTPGQNIRFGSYAGSNPLTGLLFAGEVRDGINGTIVAAFDLADAMLMPVEPHNGFTDLYGNAWTVNRAAGLTAKTALVDRPLFMFDGMNDVMVVGDTSLLDLTFGDPLTLLVLVRVWQSATGGYFFSKKQGEASSAPGYALQVHSSGTFRGRVSDGTNQASPEVAVGTFGVATPVLLLRDVVADRVQVRQGSIAGALTVDPTTTTLDSTFALQIGSLSTGNSPFGFEFLGAAFFKEALTDVQIAEVVNEFQYDPELVGTL